MVAFTWSITTVLTLFAFITAVILTIQVHTHYRRLERYYEGDDWFTNSNYYNQGGGGGGEGEQQQQQHRSGDEEYFNHIRESYVLLSTMSARSITFVAVYTMLLSTALSLYGSMAIVGFTSLRGVYIAPCFSSGYDKLQVGVFGGAIVIFANLLLVCAVVLGEVKVRATLLLIQFCTIDPQSGLCLSHPDTPALSFISSIASFPFSSFVLFACSAFVRSIDLQVADYNDRPEEQQQGQQGQEEKEPYQVERIATILAVACMFLSALYTIFAVLLFLCHAGEDGFNPLTGPPSTKMTMMMMENVGVGVGVGGVLESEAVGSTGHSKTSPLVVGVSGTSGNGGDDYLGMHHHMHHPMHHHRQQYHQMHHQMQQMHGHTMTSVHPGHTMVTDSPGFITMENSSQGTSE